MRTKDRNVYTALLFNNGSPFHLTVRYYKGMSETQIQNLIEKVKEFCIKEHPRPEVMEMRNPDWFGPAKNVRVLKPAGNVRPEWVDRLREVVPAHDTYPFNPHVTTEEEGPLNLLITGVAVIHKSTILYCHQVD